MGGETHSRLMRLLSRPPPFYSLPARGREGPRVAFNRPKLALTGAEPAALFVLLFPDVIAPHVLALGVEGRLADGKARVDQHLLRLLAGPDVLEGVVGEVDLVEEILDAIDVHVAGAEQAIAVLVAV